MKNKEKFGIESVDLSIPNDSIGIGEVVTAEVKLNEDIRNEDEVKYAWYIYHDQYILERIMYSSGTSKCAFKINKPGTWKFKAFVIFQNGEKVAKYSREIKCTKEGFKGLNQFPRESLAYDQFQKLNIDKDSPTIYTIEKNDTKYEYLIKRDEKSSRLTVIGSGTYDPNRYQLPVFQRFTWMNEIEGNVIYYNDPTLYLGSIRVGWGQGHSQEFPLPIIADMVKKFAQKMDVVNERILFYGSSSGGFMSMVLGGYVKGSSVLVNNPITVVSNSKYFDRFFNAIGKVAYEGYELDEMKREFATRLDIRAFYKSINYVPNIYCLVNAASEYDMECHFKPLLNEYNNITSHTPNKEFITHLYWDEAAQHNPVSKKQTLDHIEKVQKMWCR